MKVKKKTLLNIVLAFFWIIASIGTILGVKRLAYSPFYPMYEFSGVSEVSAGADGKTFIVDEGKKLLLELDEENRIIRQIEGGSESTAFYYAEHVCEDNEGNIYIADINYGAEGNRILVERVLMVGKQNTYALYDVDYREQGNYPLQYGNILELKNEDDHITFTAKGDGEITIYEIAGRRVKVYASIPCDFDLNDATFDRTSDSLLITTRQGDVYICSELHSSNADLQENWKRIEGSENVALPWDISSSFGTAYIADTLSGILWSIDLSNVNGELAIDEFYSDGIAYQEVNRIEDKYVGRDQILLTDLGGFSVLSTQSGEITEYLEVRDSSHWKIVVEWFALLFSVVGDLYIINCLCKYAKRRFDRLEDKQDVLRIMLVAASTVIASLVVSYSAITTVMEQEDANIGKMRLIASILQRQINGDDLYELGDDLSDFHSAQFDKVKMPLDQLIDGCYENENYYYYLIYKKSETTIDYVMDYEEAYASGQPLYDVGDNEYTKVFEDGEEIVVADDVSSYGSWMFVLLPIYDSKGNIVAELEVGTGADYLAKLRRQLIVEEICSVLATSAVVTMLILEGLFALNFWENKKKLPKEKHDSTTIVPIRLMVFLAYFTDCMQDAFIAIMCEKLYLGAEGSSLVALIPEGVAIALPMSAQLLVAAAASLFGGKIAEKYGPKKIMMIGFVFQAAGFVTCSIMGSTYIGIIIGKLAIGLGEGLIYVAANTLAAMASGEEGSSKAFADVSAGVLSGVTIGVGFGSILLSIGDYSLVYIVGALFLALGFVITLTSKNYGKENVAVAATSEENAGAEPEGRISLFKFMTDRKVISFFLLILTPFMMALSYREYFFPLFVSENGMTEVQIGQIYLLCGLLTLYFGPSLAKWVLGKFGPKMSIVFASALMAVNMLLFVVWPSIVSVMIGVGILSFVISFAYTCQYSYFETIPAFEKFGEGGSLGIYSMFESLGQTLGPILYGVALGFGQQIGLLAVSLIMLALVGGFLLLNIKAVKQA